jgi:uncharacterized membrane protein YgcG
MSLFNFMLYRKKLSFLLFVLPILIFILPSYVQAEEKIIMFSSQAKVNVDSSLEVREDITVNVEGEQIRRGIFRDFPTIYKDSSGRTVQVGFSVQEALLNGRKIPYKVESRSNGVRIYLGDPEKFVSLGEQTYTLVYITTGQIGFFEEHDELYWNVTGNAWDFPIEKVKFSVSIPEKSPFLSIDIYTGLQGAKGRNAQVFSDSTVETTKPLAPKEGLTVAYTWPKGIINQPENPLRYTFFEKFGMWFLFGTPFLLLIYYVMIWSRWGKDPYRKPVIPLFYPSKDVSPGFLRYVERMGMDNVCFTAEILNLAVKKFIVIEELTLEEAMERLGQLQENALLRGVVSFSSRLAGKKYCLKRMYSETDGKIPYKTEEEEILMSTLFDNGRDELLLRQDNHKILSNAKDKLEKHYRQKAKPLFSKNTLPWASGLLIPIFICLLLRWGGQIDMSLFLLIMTGLVLFLGTFFLSIWRASRESGRILKKIFSFIFVVIFGIGFVGSFVIGMSVCEWYMLLPPLMTAVLVIVFRKLMKVRTEKGNIVLSEAEGLAMYMKTAERHRLEMFNPPEETPEVFESLLPYAFALDTAETWANKFADILAENDYHPVWYSGKNAFSFYSGDALTGITSSISDSIASASTAPGSSSGRGGSGSSGGGGGGGGGGGW